MPDSRRTIPNLVILRDSSAGAYANWETLVQGALVTEVESVLQAQAFVGAHRADAVVVEYSSSAAGGHDLIQQLRQTDRQLPVLFFGRDMRASTAVQLIRSGADGCFDALDCMDIVSETIRALAEDHFVRRRDQASARKPAHPWRASLVGNSPAMEEVVETILLVGSRRCTVLITGETGTGKEVAARALHMSSPRARHNFVAINCSALPENLLEAELFGHVRGAFTGAMNQRIGRFEQAHSGTLFLDEIGDMPLDLQAKLLRVLQEREFQRLGSSETIKVDIRVIAATNVDLKERIRQGKFREDLYYRLNVVPLALPPLRKRNRDIAMLAEHFVTRICEMEDVPVKAISPEAMNRLCAAEWPGNVRQLENNVERAVAVSGSRTVLSARDFGFEGEPAAQPISRETRETPGMVDFQTAVSQFELAMLNQALQQSGGNKTVAAEKLGIKRTTLIMKMRALANTELLQPLVA